ncbi:LytTR family DNA-binding domain-containing protein [Gracilimonas sp.]|uniref:LytR/AlgR family response regulator transcription factor n=2 Tax=Gracilimonas sp. TaxID=1974203 RepID=UPI0032F01466
MPFILCLMIALKLPGKFTTIPKAQNILYYVGIGFLNFLGYIVITNVVLYLLNFSTSLISENFFWKYLTGIVQVHLTLYLFVHFYRHKTSQQTNAPKFIQAAKGSTTYTVKITDISWIESYDHYVKLHTAEGVFLRRDTMKNILTDLGNDFVRIHRKFIVNKHFVKRTEKKEGKTFIVVNDKKLKVSNSYLQKVSRILNSTV